MTDPAAHLGLLLAVILVAAKVGSELATRLKQPAVLGELVVGMVLGSLPWLRDFGSDPAVDVLARLGVLLLLFEVGLESTVRDVLEVGTAAARVAVLGTVATLALGWAVAAWLMPSSPMATHAFVGAAITATSVGITARVFKDLGRTRSSEARTILGAAVLDDVFGLIVLALVSGSITRASAGEPGPPSAASWLWLGVKTLGFLALAVLVGVKATPKIFAAVARLRTSGALLAFGLAFCFFLAWAAAAMDLAPIVGAFAAGLVLEELHSARFVARGERSLSQLIEPISSFLVPIFFVVMGIRADIRVFLEPATLLLAVALTGAAVLGKLACSLGVPRGVNRLTVAIGMMPRGEVSLSFASLGMTLAPLGVPVLDRRGYSALVAVVVLTAVLTPTALKWSFSNKPRERQAAGT